MVGVTASGTLDHAGPLPTLTVVARAVVVPLVAAAIVEHLRVGWPQVVVARGRFQVLVVVALAVGAFTPLAVAVVAVCGAGHLESFEQSA